MVLDKWFTVIMYVIIGISTCVLYIVYASHMLNYNLMCSSYTHSVCGFRTRRGGSGQTEKWRLSRILSNPTVLGDNLQEDLELEEEVPLEEKLR